jgi:opacity protein-like surface antigen
MKPTLVLALLLISLSTTAFAQERAYVEGFGGFATSASSATPNLTSGDAAFEAGVRVAPHVSVFGDVGRFANLTPSTVEPTVDSTVSALASNDGLDVTGSVKMPAKYVLGGARWDALSASRISPFVLGGIGVAHLTPKAIFNYTEGIVPNADPNASTPAMGDDVTTPIVSAGLFAQPVASTSFMMSFGGGLDVSLARHWAADAEYRFSRVSADTPLHAQGLAFGLGYRF